VQLNQLFLRLSKMVEVKDNQKMEKIEKPVEDTKKVIGKKDVKIEEVKTEKIAKTTKKTTKKEIVKKDKAVARGNSLRISPKYSKYTCRLIKKRTPERAIELLEQVVNGKLAVKMPSLELPHQKGKGVAGGRFPKNVASEFIKVVKQLSANCLVNNINDPVIVIAMSNAAAAPTKRGGRKAKRTNLYLEAVEKIKLVKKKSSKNKK